MSRQLWVQYEGAVYHFAARGNSGQDIYTGDQDRNQCLDFLVHELEQQRWFCHAYCLMGTHYHLNRISPAAWGDSTAVTASGSITGMLGTEAMESVHDDVAHRGSGRNVCATSRGSVRSQAP